MLFDPSKVSSQDRESQITSLSQGKDLDNIVAKMSNLTTWLRTKEDRPVVYYIHCEAGVDRTGEVAGNYMLKHWRNQTFAKALSYDASIEPRDINAFSANGMAWYCLYLFKFTGITTLACPGQNTWSS